MQILALPFVNRPSLIFKKMDIQEKPLKKFNAFRNFLYKKKRKAKAKQNSNYKIVFAKG